MINKLIKSTASRVLLALIAFAGIRIYTSALDSEGLGQMSLLLTSQSMTLIFLVSPVGQYLNSIAFYLPKNLERATLKLLLMYITAIYLPVLMFNIYYLEKYDVISILLLTLGFVANGFIFSILSYLNFKGDTDISIFINILYAGATLLFSTLLVWHYGTELSWVFGMTISSIAFMIYFLYKYTLWEPIPLTKVRSLLRMDMTNFILPLYASGFFYWYLMNGFRLDVSRYFGVEYLGLLFVGYSVATQIIGVMESIFSHSITPYIVKGTAGNSIDFGRIYTSFVIVSIFFIIVFTLNSKLILKLFLGSAYRQEYESFFNLGVITEFFRVAFNILSSGWQGKRRYLRVIIGLSAGALVTITLFKLFGLTDQNPIVFVLCGWLASVSILTMLSKSILRNS